MYIVHEVQNKIYKMHDVEHVFQLSKMNYTLCCTKKHPYHYMALVWSWLPYVFQSFPKVKKKFFVEFREFTLS